MVWKMCAAEELKKGPQTEKDRVILNRNPEDQKCTYFELEILKDKYSSFILNALNILCLLSSALLKKNALSW